MKNKDLISITLKIIGIIAFWKAIQTFGVVISGIGVFSTLFANNDQMNSSFMFAIGLSMILNFILPLMVAFLFLFRTEKVLSTLKIKDQGNVDLKLNKLVIYHMIIIVMGFMTIMHGTGNFLAFKYNVNTKTEYITNNSVYDNQSADTTKQENIVVTNSKSKDINYFALIEILFGIVLLTKATALAKRLERDFDSKTASQTKEEAITDSETLA